MRSEIVKIITTSIIRWYQFEKDCKILYLGNKEDAIYEMLNTTNKICCTVDKTLSDDNIKHKYKNDFDYVIVIEKLERRENIKEVLTVLRSYLKCSGKLLFGMNNRFGIRYFAGDRDIYTNRALDGIDNYRKFYRGKNSKFQGRMYNKVEIEDILNSVGFKKFQFYSVLSDLQNAKILCSERFTPEEDLTNRITCLYNNPCTVFFDEVTLYKDLIENNMFHQMANAFFIECTVDGDLSKELYITSHMDRSDENCIITTIKDDYVVEKKAVYNDDNVKIKNLMNNTNELKERGIPVVDARLENNVFIMPYIKSETGQVYLKRILKENKDLFLEQMDNLCDLILKSSDIVRIDEELGPILSKGYVDMVPLNCFFKDNKFMFFDQEFVEENYPSNAIIYRCISTFYAYDDYLEKLIPRAELLKRYGLYEAWAKWQSYETEFLNSIIKNDDLRIYIHNQPTNYEIINSNQLKINYSDKDYKKLFVDVFSNMNGRKIVLFGATNTAKRFYNMYSNNFEIECIIDNNAERWGEEFGGLTIKSPDLLLNGNGINYKVIICIKNYEPVLEQISNMDGVTVSIFDVGKSYAIPSYANVKPESISPKKYKVGYVAGVFDMFHVGHVNLLRKAKDQCEFLVVGIVPDEHVKKLKNKCPIIQEDERLAVIEACRYADKVYILPEEHTSIIDAYKMFNFDCQFTGDDHENNVEWLLDKDYLKGQGVDLMFLPYTTKISSTLIRSKLL